MLLNRDLVTEIGFTAIMPKYFGIATTIGWYSIESFLKYYAYLPQHAELLEYLQTHYPEYLI